MVAIESSAVMATRPAAQRHPPLPKTWQSVAALVPAGHVKPMGSTTLIAGSRGASRSAGTAESKIQQEARGDGGDRRI